VSVITFRLTNVRNAQVLGLDRRLRKDLASAPVVEFWTGDPHAALRLANALAIALWSDEPALSAVLLHRPYRKGDVLDRPPDYTARLGSWYAMRDPAELSGLLAGAWNETLDTAQVWAGHGLEVDRFESPQLAAVSWILSCGADGVLVQAIAPRAGGVERVQQCAVLAVQRIGAVLRPEER
jgi:hypothetical protein